MNISGPFIARPIATALLMVGLLLAGQPLLGPRNQPGIHVVDLRHIEELHQSVAGEDLVGGR